MEVDKKFTFIMPVAGKGTRFKEAGITVPKPKIRLGDRYLYQMAEGNMDWDLIDEVVYIEHADYPVFSGLDILHFDMYNTTGAVSDPRFNKPDNTIFKLNHTVIQQRTPLLGAADTVRRALSVVDDNKPVVIANCDQVFSVYDSEKDSLKMVLSGEIAGLIPVFNGDRQTKWSYAEMDENFHISGILEKPTIDQIDNFGLKYATVGVYYFSSAAIIKNAIDSMMENEDTVNGEYYLAPAYNYLPRNLTVLPQIVDKMYGLGTPEDIDLFMHEHRHLGFYDYDWREVNSDELETL